MTVYHKIQTVWLRDPTNNYKTLLEGSWAKPEFGYLADCPWILTEKVDGTNVRLYRTDLRIGGKTDSAQLYPGLLTECHKITECAAFRALPEGMILYGEGYGEKIQAGGGLYRKGQGFILFDVWCNIWLERASVEEIGNALGVPVVPVVTQCRLTEMIELVRGGMKSLVGERLSEGVVARPALEMLNRSGGRIITKLKAKDFPEVA